MVRRAQARQHAQAQAVARPARCRFILTVQPGEQWPVRLDFPVIYLGQPAYTFAALHDERRAIVVDPAPDHRWWLVGFAVVGGRYLAAEVQVKTSTPVRVSLVFDGFAVRHVPV